MASNYIQCPCSHLVSWTMLSRNYLFLKTFFEHLGLFINETSNEPSRHSIYLIWAPQQDAVNQPGCQRANVWKPKCAPFLCLFHLPFNLNIARQQLFFESSEFICYPLFTRDSLQNLALCLELLQSIQTGIRALSATCSHPSDMRSLSEWMNILEREGHTTFKQSSIVHTSKDLR